MKSLIISLLSKEYDFFIQEIEELHLGADIHAATYKVVSREGRSYFLKVRHKRSFSEKALLISSFLHKVQGFQEVVSPIPTQRGELFLQMLDYNLILYPFISGKNGWERRPSQKQWKLFGQLLSKIHKTDLPFALKGVLIAKNKGNSFRHRFSSEVLGSLEQKALKDPKALRFTHILREHQEILLRILQQAQDLAPSMEKKVEDCSVLCHTDLHLGNLLMGDDQSLHIVDWDGAMLAPKERDLMFIGGGVGCTYSYRPDEEEGPFYEGYGEKEVDLCAIKYYRSERVIEDFVDYYEQFFSFSLAENEAEEALVHIQNMFLPDGVVDRSLLD